MSFTVADLRPVDLFDDIDDDQLAEWAKVATARNVAAGETIAEQGEPTPFVMLLEGTVAALLIEGERSEPVGRQQAPTWMGAIAVLTGARSGSAHRPSPTAGWRSSTPPTSGVSRSPSPPSTTA